MLVLTRRIGEEIVVDGNIRITLVAIKGNQVRLGVSAPPLIPVHRSELLQAGNNPGAAALDEITAVARP